MSVVKYITGFISCICLLTFLVGCGAGYRSSTASAFTNLLIETTTGHNTNISPGTFEFLNDPEADLEPYNATEN